MSTETGLLKAWPKEGPPLLWRLTELGEGIASVSVAEGRVYTLGYHEDGEFVFALNALTGETLWISRVGPAVPEDRLMRWLSQRTPTVDQNRLYTITASGELFCLQTADGQQLWHTSYPKDYLSKRRIWGFCEHPLVDGEKLICAPGGPGATVVALNKNTGGLIWKTKTSDDEGGSYAASVVSEAGGIHQYVAFLQKGLAGIAANDGRVLWRYSKTVSLGLGSYTPLVRGDFVFSANGYGGGMALVKLVREGDEFKVEERYHKTFNFNPFQDSTVLVGDHVYGFQRSAPVCIELETGNLVWGPISTAIQGRAGLTYADGHLYLRGSKGLMILVEATPKAYVEKGAFQIPDPEEASGVTSPVIAGRRLYLRDNSRLLCYDIAEEALNRPRPGIKTNTVSFVSARDQTEKAATTPPHAGKDRPPDAVYVPTPADVLGKMLELAEVKRQDVLYDLGSGDGRIAISAARNYGCKAVGYEIDERLVNLSREAVRQNNLESLVRIEHEDIFTVDLRGADVITVFLFPRLLERLRPQFDKLKPGSKIVSHQFEIPGVPPDKVLAIQSKEDGDQHRLFLWTTPLKRKVPANEPEPR